jgi:superfamily I DNA/RNA helicase
MTQSNQPNDRDLFTRVVQLEYRLTRLENNQAQLDNTMTPGGYITEAFDRLAARLRDRVLEEIDTVKAQNEEMKGMIAEQNGKIDLILRGITGLGNS